jgi:hypothetical protein
MKFFALILSLVALLMFTIALLIKIEYWNSEMGNEAFGPYSFAILLGIVFGIPATILLRIIVRRKKGI